MMGDIKYEDFHEKVLKSEKLVVVMLHREECPDCKAASPLFEKIGKDKQFSGAEFVKLEISEQLNRPKEIGEVQSVPTFAFFKQGKQIKRITDITSVLEEVASLV